MSIFLHETKEYITFRRMERIKALLLGYLCSEM